ncbi:MAG: hypothetical protein KF716_14200 [Anaerolineae bacterium]|nr:hypothetical protein [Anaerolineae bacterium]
MTNETANAGQSMDELFNVARSALLKFQEESNADVFVISSGISMQLADEIVNTVERLEVRRPNAIVFLATLGGDADAAFIIARVFKRCYKHFSLYICGYCKSAGTLIALGADKIVMSAMGQLGPLDVQLLRDDNIAVWSSGQDIYRALNALQQQAFDAFENVLINVIARSGGVISVKTAAHIATEMTVGLISPITSQLEPMKIGEIERAMAVAWEYGKRLGADPAKVYHLIYDYPSHSFVIDYEEAKDLFKSVSLFSPSDYMVEASIALLQVVAEQPIDLRMQNPEGIFIKLNLENEEEDDTPPEEPEEMSNDETETTTEQERVNQNHNVAT